MIMMMSKYLWVNDLWCHARLCTIFTNKLGVTMTTLRNLWHKWLYKLSLNDVIMLRKLRRINPSKFDVIKIIRWTQLKLLLTKQWLLSHVTIPRLLRDTEGTLVLKESLTGGFAQVVMVLGEPLNLKESHENSLGEWKLFYLESN